MNKQPVYVILLRDYSTVITSNPEQYTAKAVWKCSSHEASKECMISIGKAIAPKVLQMGIKSWKHIKELISDEDEDEDIVNPVDIGKEPLSRLYRACALCHLQLLLYRGGCDKCPLIHCKTASNYYIAYTNRYSTALRLKACDNIIAAHYEMAKQLGVEIKDSRKSLKTLLKTVEGGELV